MYTDWELYNNLNKNFKKELIMFNFLKKNTTDLVKEWNAKYTNELMSNPDLSKQDREDIINYVSNNKDELTIVLSSLTEAARLKNGDKISKDLFNTILEWIHTLVWSAIVSGVKTDTSFKKSYDYVFEAYKETANNPEEALSKYKTIVGDEE